MEDVAAEARVIHPVRMLWTHMGEPVPAVTFSGDERCRLCGTVGPVRDAATVVSDQFTDWELYPDFPVWWCPACVWAHTTISLRTTPWWMSSTGGGQLNRASLHRLLSSPVGADTAVVVPLSRHKHLLPRARFGVVTTDDMAIAWDDTQVRCLSVMGRLRRFGFGEKALQESVPRWPVLVKQSQINQETIMVLWPKLDRWRQAGPVMGVGLRACRGADDGA